MTCHLNTIVLFLFLQCLLCGIDSYRPVVLIHGVLTGQESMQVIAERIATLHPGTRVYVTNRYAGWSSLEPMWHQVEEIGADLLYFSALHPGGIHLLGYSQGGLVARAILERYPEHNVQTFIALSSPQAGQYGTKFLHIFFPNLACKTAYELFYSAVGQHTSVGNYWRDPHHQPLYFNYSRFLPYVNNELFSSQSEDFKQGFTKLKKLVLIGGPDDQVITPWQSSQFGYYDEEENVVEMHDQDFYKNDNFGLRTLDEEGKVVLVKVDGINHFAWHLNVSFIDQYVIPYLD